MMDVPKEMATTYADCGSRVNYSRRRMNWHADGTTALSFAAEAYGCIEGYNEFRPKILGDLAAAFKGKGIEVICGRESSVVIYLLIPEMPFDLANDVFTFARDEMGADEVDFVEKILGDNSDRYFGTCKLLRIWWE